MSAPMIPPGLLTCIPVPGVARSGRIAKNWARSKKNGSDRAPAKTDIPGVGEKVVLIAPVVA